MLVKTDFQFSIYQKRLIYISVVCKPFLCVAFIFGERLRLLSVANEVFGVKMALFLICCKLGFYEDKKQKVGLQHHEKINEKMLARKNLYP